MTMRSSNVQEQTMTIDIDSRDDIAQEGAEGLKTASAADSSVTPRPPRMPGRRNPKWIALGIVAFASAPCCRTQSTRGSRESEDCCRRGSPHRLPGRDDRAR